MYSKQCKRALSLPLAGQMHQIFFEMKKIITAYLSLRIFKIMMKYLNP